MANEVRVLVKADTKNAVDNLEKVDKAASGIGTGAKVAGAALLGIGAAGVAGLGVSINTAAKFEHALDQVGAVANATEAEMKGLSDTALRIGKDTAFSATEAAGAMEMLAANGVSVADIMNGAADAAVALAAAGGTDLATAADTASTAMAVWKLSAKDMNDVVNRLAGAANVSRFGVEDMSLAIAQGGGAAKTAGVEFGDFAAAIAAIAPSFSSGSDAGTSMKTFLANLVPDTKAATRAMTDLGIITKDGANQFFTAKGELKSMAEIAGILNKATAGLTEEQKTLALNVMFGSDAMRAAAALSGLTAEEFQKLQDTMGNTNAADVAAQRMGNLNGSMEALKGSIETIQIEIGTVFLPVLAKMADFAATQLPVAFETAKAKFLEWKPTLIELAASARETMTTIAAAVAEFVQAARPHFIAFANEAKQQFQKFQVYYESDLKPAFENIRKGVEYVVGVFQDNWPKIQPIVQGVINIVQNFAEGMKNVVALVVDLIGGDWSGAWKNAKEIVVGAVNGVLLQYKLLWEGLKAVIGIVRTVGEDVMDGLLEGLNAGGKAVWAWLQDLGPAVIRFIGDVSELLLEAGKAIAGSLLAGLVEGAKAVWTELSQWGDKIKSLKGPLNKDRILLYEEGKAIAGGLRNGMREGFAYDVRPEIDKWAPEIKGTLGTALATTFEDLAWLVENQGGLADIVFGSDMSIATDIQRKTAGLAVAMLAGGEDIEQVLGDLAWLVENKGGLLDIVFGSDASIATDTQKKTALLAAAFNGMAEVAKVGAAKVATAAGVPGAAADLSGGKSYTWDPTQNKWVPVGTSNETFGGMSTAGLEAAAAGVAAGGGNLAGVPGHNWVFKDGKWQLESIQNTSANPWYFNTINSVTGKRETGTLNPNTGYPIQVVINGDVNTSNLSQTVGDIGYALQNELASRGVAA